MKIFIFFITLLISFIGNAQDVTNYKFDYYTFYAIKKDSNTTVIYRYIIGNSKDVSYSLYIDLTSDNFVRDMFLFDRGKRKQYQFVVENKRLESLKNFNDLTKSYHLLVNTFDRENVKKNYIGVDYKTLNDEEIVTINVYENRRKKKIKHQAIYYTQKYHFVKNQFYISDIVFANKIDLNSIKTEGVVTKTYHHNKNSKEKIMTHELLDISQLDFKLELKNN